MSGAEQATLETLLERVDLLTHVVQAEFETLQHVAAGSRRSSSMADAAGQQEDVLRNENAIRRNTFDTTMIPDEADVGEQIELAASLEKIEALGYGQTDSSSSNNNNSNTAFGSFDDQTLASLVEQNCNIYKYKEDRENFSGRIRLPRTIVRPDSPWKAAWDVMIMILVVFYAFVVPVRIAFYKGNPWKSETIFDMVADMLFVIDIVLSFRTTFKENGRWVTDGKRLALRYLKSWFILDLLSTIPFNLAIDIETLTESDTTKQVAAQQSGGARVNKLGRLVRLVNLGRIVRLFEKVPSLQKFLFTQPVITSIVGTILSLFIIWHFVACTYWFVAVTIEYDHYTFVPCPMMADRIEPKGIWMFSDYCKGYGTCILDGCDSDALKNATCIEYPLSAMNTRAHMEGGHDDSYATDLAAFAIWPWGSVSGLDTTTAMSADTYGTRSTWRAYAPNVSAHCYQDNWFRRSWLPDPWQSHDSTILQYSSSLTWAIEATTGNGGEIVPENQLEHVVTMFAIAAGIMVYACIIGSITVALSATNNDTAQKRHQIKEMNRYMKRKKVPTFFRSVVHDYQEHVFLDPHKVPEAFAHLPPSLRHRLLLVLNLDLFNKFEVFRDLPGRTWVKLVSSMKSQRFLPGEFITRTGEEDPSMCFIVGGMVDQVDESHCRPKVIKTLKEGEFFGEMEMMESCRRVSSTRAVDYCTVLRLHHRDFVAACSANQAFLNDLRKFAEQRHNALDLPPCAKAGDSQGQQDGWKPPTLQAGDRPSRPLNSNDLFSTGGTSRSQGDVPPGDDFERKESSGDYVLSAEGGAAAQMLGASTDGGDESLAFRMVNSLWGRGKGATSGADVVPVLETESQEL